MNDGLKNFTQWFYNETMQSSDGFIYKKVVVRKMNGTLYLSFPSGKTCALFLCIREVARFSLPLSPRLCLFLSPPPLYLCLYICLSSFLSLSFTLSIFSIPLSLSLSLSASLALSLSVTGYLSSSPYPSLSIYPSLIPSLSPSLYPSLSHSLSLLKCPMVCWKSNVSSIVKLFKMN